MELKPLFDRVVLKMTEAEKTTKSGIILTESAAEKPQVAEVVAVGPGGMVDGNEVVMSESVGDKSPSYCPHPQLLSPPPSRVFRTLRAR